MSAPVALRTNGIWLPLVTAAGASTETTQAATDLAAVLGRIAAPAPSIVHSGTGIMIGLTSELSASEGVLDATANWSVDNFGFGTVGTANKTFCIVGQAGRGVQAAAASFLKALGYNRLATNRDWEVVSGTIGANVSAPTTSGTKTLRFNAFTPIGFVFASAESATASGSDSTYNSEWNRLNHVIQDGIYSYGHAYASIIDSTSSFTDHPSWRPGDGADAGNKLCVFETGVQAAAFDWAKDVINGTSPPSKRKAVSMSAADGTVGWSGICSGTNEQATYSVSDRVLKLANATQTSLIAEGYSQSVAYLAYSDSSVAPTVFRPHQSTITVWATAFMANGLSANEVLESYVNLYDVPDTAKHMPYEYPSEYPWDYDLPGIARATQRSELQTTIDRLSTSTGHCIGWTGESSAAWIPYGRWYWSLAATMISDDPYARWDNWTALAFPTAKTQADVVYSILETRAPLSPDFIHRLCQGILDLLNLLEASGASTAEINRALDLGRYAVYVTYWRSYQISKSATTLEPVLQWCFRIRKRDIITYRAAYSDVGLTTDRQAIAALYGKADLLVNQPVWADTPTTESEIRTLLTAAVAANALLSFVPVGYSLDLVRVGGLTHASSVRGAFVEQTKSTEFWYHAGSADIFTFKGGVVSQLKGPDHVKIYEFASGEVIWEQDIPEDRVSRTTAPGNGFYPTIPTKAQRLYKIAVTAAGGLTWSWQVGTGVTFIPTEDLSIFTAGYSGYFYVPVGTTQIGFFAQNGTIRLFSADNVQQGGNIVAANDYYSVTVPEGKDGQCWKMTGAVNKFGLMTVPPEMALAPAELLLPREVQEADGLPLADAVAPSTPSYTPVSFGTDLIPPATTLSVTGAVGYYSYAGVAGTLFYLSAVGTSTTLHIKGGIVSATKGNSVLTVTDMTDNSTQTITVTNQDKTTVDYAITTISGRLYKIALTTVGGAVYISWDTGVRMSAIGLGQAIVTEPFVAGYGGCFYVPKNTTVIGFYADGGTIKFYQNNGSLVSTVTAARAFYQFNVPSGQAGKVWRFTGVVGRFELQTVPPEFSIRANELILPSAVVVADGI